ncbi:FtsX-like permease family protein [Bacteroidota bacterium]
MLKNYFTVTFRNLNNNKTHSFINIYGLATGLACCILILFFIRDELSYDLFHKNIDRIFHVNATIAYSPSSIVTRQAPMHFGPILKEKFAEVEDFVRTEREEFTIKHNNTIFKQDGLFVEKSFFNIFTFPLIAGNPAEALKESQSIVISETTAKKYFGLQNSLGKTLSIKIKDQFQDFIVTGVIQQPPSNSSIQFDFLINLKAKYGNLLSDANSKEFISTFILLSHQDKAQELIAKFDDTVNKELQIGDVEGSGFQLYLFKNHHLKKPLLTGIVGNSSKPIYSIILSGISFLVLLIACFNFTNLSIGSASSRIKEIGIRKVLGAYKKHIARQFLFESFLQSMLAALLGIILARLLLPAFNSFSSKSLTFDLFNDGIIILIGLCLFVSIIAGGYPSLVLSRFSSVDLFKGKMKLSRTNTMSRMLIVMQFSISIILIIATLFMYRQYNFMLNKDLGYNSNQVIGILLDDLPESAKQNNSFYNIFKNNLLQHKTIESICGSNSSFDQMGMASFVNSLDGKPLLLGINIVDYDFIPTFEMQILKGRNFSENFSGDPANAVIVNEVFIKDFGIESPVGRSLAKCIKWNESHEIIGILKNYNTESLNSPIRPAIFMLTHKHAACHRYVYVKIKSEEIRQTIDIIEQEFKKITRDVPFIFNFVDVTVAKQYENEKRWSLIITYASALAILIACSGLFGLTLLIVVRRTKEIGIRKVLGASITKITKLLNLEFMWLVAIANIIAWPISYFVMNHFLDNYAYRISLSWWVFGLSGLLTLAIATITISFHAIKAAKANPIKALSYE